MNSAANQEVIPNGGSRNSGNKPPWLVETQERTQAILNFARTFFRPGDVTELRVLKYQADDHIRYNLSGYFNYDHLDKLARSAARSSGQSDGVYWTINPLKAECLDRRSNVVSQALKKESTADVDFRGRRWIAIDIDSKRPDKKLSATEEEKSEVFEGAKEISALLAAGGWDAKHQIDSGNGVHLYFEVSPEMLTDDDETAFFLDRMSAKFPNLDIDTTVGNLARIMRIPGTMNCKGKPTKERPHRYAKVIQGDLNDPNRPKNYTITRAQFLAILESLPPASKPSRSARPATFRNPPAAGGATSTAEQPKRTPLAEKRRREAYGKSALKDACDKIRNATPGTRNPTLNEEAFEVFQLAYGGVIDIIETEMELMRAAEECGLDADEIPKTIQSAKEAASKEPRGMPERDNGSSSNPPSRSPSVSGGARKTIIINDPSKRRRVSIEEGLAALDATNRVFLRNGKLVEIVERRNGKVDPTLSFEEIEEHALGIILEEQVDFAESKPATNGQTVLKNLDLPTTRYLKGMLQWSGKHAMLRTVSAVSSFPLMLPSGQITRESGYYPERELWYQPRREFLLPPAQPTRGEAHASANELLALIREFPFEFGGVETVWLSLILTLIAREIIDGGVPMFAVDASRSGSGKGLLCSTAMLIATGQEWPGSHLPLEEVEQNKTILSHLLAGSPVVYLDNCRYQIQGSPIEAALTMPTYSGRLLGRSKIVTAPSRAVWIATGNSLTFSADMTRRVVPMRLVPREEDPTHRTFHISDLKSHVKLNLERLNRCATTILVAWSHAGRPERSGKLMSSFEAWHATIGGITQFLDLPDPCERVVEQIGVVDLMGETLPELIACLSAIIGTEQANASEIIRRVRRAADSFDDEVGKRCQEVIVDALGVKHWQKSTRGSWVGC